MDLNKCASACNRLALELEESLTTDDVEALRADCAALGLMQWAAWVRENAPTILKFVEATASVRNEKAWQAPEMKRRLVLAAMQHVNDFDEHDLFAWQPPLNREPHQDGG